MVTPVCSLRSHKIPTLLRALRYGSTQSTCINSSQRFSSPNSLTLFCMVERARACVIIIKGRARTPAALRASPSRSQCKISLINGSIELMCCCAAAGERKVYSARVAFNLLELLSTVPRVLSFGTSKARDRAAAPCHAKLFADSPISSDIDIFCCEAEPSDAAV
jgi:hypothetical protein